MSHLALVNYGHFTSMQVRRGRVRGLDLHLSRLGVAHLELFGATLDTVGLRSLMRGAVADQADASLRVTGYEVEPGVPRVMTAIRPAAEAPTWAQTLTEVRYVRPLPHLKHVGSFAQIRYGLLAERAGFDDALLVSDDGRVVETTTANVGIISGQEVVWPDAPPCLRASPGNCWMSAWPHAVAAFVGKPSRSIRSAISTPRSSPTPSESALSAGSGGTSSGPTIRSSLSWWTSTRPCRGRRSDQDVSGAPLWHCMRCRHKRIGQRTHST